MGRFPADAVLRLFNRDEPGPSTKARAGRDTRRARRPWFRCEIADAQPPVFGMAAGQGWHEEVWRLSENMVNLLMLRRRLDDLLWYRRSRCAMHAKPGIQLPPLRRCACTAPPAQGFGGSMTPSSAFGTRWRSARRPATGTVKGGCSIISAMPTWKCGGSRTPSPGAYSGLRQPDRAAAY